MFNPSKEQRISFVILTSSSFFLLEIVIGLRNRSLALVADAFHVVSDLVGFGVALYAIRKQKDPNVPMRFSFGWQRAELLGAFFNGVFLFALGVSVLLQTIERFLRPVAVRDPKLILIVGAVGLGLNVLSALVIGHQGHDQSSPKKNDDDNPASLSSHTDHAHITAMSDNPEPHSFADIGILGVALHLLGDAINNIAVMISAGVFLATHFLYADPIASAFVGFMILLTSGPLMLKSGRILLESASTEVDFRGIEEDINRVEGVEGVHELHVWNLTQSKTLATIHIATSNDSLRDFMVSARRINECLHHWGVHNQTIQPEFVSPSHSTSRDSSALLETTVANTSSRATSTQLVKKDGCQLRCIEPDCEEVCCD